MCLVGGIYNEFNTLKICVQKAIEKKNTFELLFRVGNYINSGSLMGPKSVQTSTFVDFVRSTDNDIN